MKLAELFKTKHFTDKVKTEAEKMAQKIIKDQGYLTPDQIKETHVPKEEYDALNDTAVKLQNTIDNFEITINDPIDPVAKAGSELTPE